MENYHPVDLTVVVPVDLLIDMTSFCGSLPRYQKASAVSWIVLILMNRMSSDGSVN